MLILINGIDVPLTALPQSMITVHFDEADHRQITPCAMSGQPVGPTYLRQQNESPSPLYQRPVTTSLSLLLRKLFSNLKLIIFLLLLRAVPYLPPSWRKPLIPVQQKRRFLAAFSNPPIINLCDVHASLLFSMHKANISAFYFLSFFCKIFTSFSLFQKNLIQSANILYLF